MADFDRVAIGDLDRVAIGDLDGVANGDRVSIADLDGVATGDLDGVAIGDLDRVAIGDLDGVAIGVCFGIVANEAIDTVTDQSCIVVYAFACWSITTLSAVDGRLVNVTPLLHVPFRRTFDVYLQSHTLLPHHAPTCWCRSADNRRSSCPPSYNLTSASTKGRLPSCPESLPSSGCSPYHTCSPKCTAAHPCSRFRRGSPLDCPPMCIHM
jgi:hypothetical protein